jgi:hypothetical protein
VEVVVTTTVVGEVVDVVKGGVVAVVVDVVVADAAVVVVNVVVVVADVLLHDANNSDVTKKKLNDIKIIVLFILSLLFYSYFSNN